MNLLVDCSYIGKTWKPSDSLVIYAARLIEGLIRYSHIQPQVLIWKDKEKMMDDLVGCPMNKIVIERSDLPTNWRPYYRLLNILPKVVRQEIDNRKISAVLLPFHCDVLFYYPKNIKHYAIAHDMLIYDMNKRERGAFKYFLWRQYQNYLTRKFTRLITISKYTHDEVLRTNGVESDIVYNSIPFEFNSTETTVDSVLGRKYILDVNRFDQRKNPQVLIQAFNLLRDKIPHFLYLKGESDQNGNYKCLKTLVSDLGLENRVILDTTYRTEGEMNYLYSHADLFVSPSLKEGFGWTPIEAAVLKTPVLVSDIEVFREVTCNKIQTFNPHSPDDLSGNIMEKLKNPPSKQELNDLADFFLQQYSLKNQIMQLERVLEA